MDLHIDLTGNARLGEAIYRQLRQAIVHGRLRTGDRLPATRHLAHTLDVARSTVTVAYERLAGEGLIESRVGAGTFVSAQIARAPPVPLARQQRSVLTARPAWGAVPLSSAFAHPARFDFRTGLPDATLFPRQAWHRLLGRGLREAAAEAGIYGEPAGHPALRAAIARHIGTSRGVQASADDVTISNGTQQAVDIIARVLLEPGDTVVVEAPGYTPPRYLFESLGMRVVGVPVDHEGLVVDALPARARLVQVTPSHQYPLGVPLSLRRRIALLAWAERSNAAIIEDDYDSEFRFDGRQVPPLATLDTAGRVIYVGSFSKSILPTLRLGFLVAPPALRAAVHRAKYVADWHSEVPIQAALARFIDDGGFARHIRRMNNIYRERHARVVAALRGPFADEFELLPSSHGLHVAALARSASVPRIEAFAQRAARRGVAIHTLASIGGRESVRAGLAFGYGAIPTPLIDQGLERLRNCIKAAD